MPSASSGSLAAIRPVHRIVRRISAGEDLATVLEAVIEGVVDLVGFRVAAISLLPPDLDFEVVGVAGDAAAREALLGTRMSMAEMEAELAASDREDVLFFMPAERVRESDGGWIPPASDVGAPAAPDAWRAADTLRGVLRSPTGELLGLLAVDLPVDGRRPSRGRRELLEMYVELAGLAVHNARRASRLADRARLVAAVDEIRQSLAGVRALDEVTEQAVAAVRAAFDADQVWLRVRDDLDPDGPGAGAQSPPVPDSPTRGVLGHAHRDAELGWRAGLLLRARRTAEGSWSTASTSPTPATGGGRVPVAGGDAGWVPSTAAVSSLDDVDSDVIGFMDSHAVGALLMCPFGAAERYEGYLVVARVEAREWSPEETEALWRLGRLLGETVVSVRLLQHEMALVRQLQAIDRYQADLVSTISHELRTPLTAALGHLELIQDAAGPVASSTSMEVINRNLGRVVALTESLLQLKQLDDDDPAERDVVDLQAITEDVVGALRPHAATLGVHLQIGSRPGPVLFNARHEEIERVVMNLVDNAVKYSPFGGRVEVTAEQAGRFVRFVCRDTGLGISHADQEQLFSEFFRSSNPDARTRPGTGLGLSIVRRIVHRHDGSVRVESDLGHGSTFVVLLPLS